MHGLQAALHCIIAHVGPARSTKPLSTEPLPNQVGNLAAALFHQHMRIFLTAGLGKLTTSTLPAAARTASIVEADMLISRHRLLSGL